MSHSSLLLLIGLLGCGSTGMVATDANPDSGPPECPPSYMTKISSSPSSYRIITVMAGFAAQDAACSQDSSGSTHLVALNTVDEASQLRAALPQLPGDRFYVGAVQRPQQTSTQAGWKLITGEDLLAALWVPAGSIGFQPDDGEGSHGVEDAEQDHAQLFRGAPSGFLYDENGSSIAAAVCECDGRTIIVL